VRVTGVHTCALPIYDMSSRGVYAAAAIVAAGLDGDTVVTSIKVAIFNDHILTGFRIAAIRIGAEAVAGNAFYSNALAQHRVDQPERCTGNSHAFYQHIFATIGLKEWRTQVGSVGIEALLGWNALFCVGK